MSKKIIKNSRGVTLIEVILVIVLLAIIIPPLINMAGTGAVKSLDSERMIVALGKAQGLMEEIKSKHYDHKTDPPYSYPLGPDTGESASDKNTFNDMDDYQGWQESFQGLTLSVTVYYLNPADLNTNSNLIPSATPGWQEGTYKRVQVQVHDTSGRIEDFSLVTVVTP